MIDKFYIFLFFLFIVCSAYSEENSCEGRDYSRRQWKEGAGSSVNDNGERLVEIKMFPNPFSDLITIQYEESAGTKYKLFIVNLTGVVIKHLTSAKQQKDITSFQWDGTNEFGKQVAKGIYLLKAQTGKTTRCYNLIYL